MKKKYWNISWENIGMALRKNFGWNPGNIKNYCKRTRKKKHWDVLEKKKRNVLKESASEYKLAKIMGMIMGMALRKNKLSGHTGQNPSNIRNHCKRTI